MMHGQTQIKFDLCVLAGLSEASIMLRLKVAEVSGLSNADNRVFPSDASIVLEWPIHVKICVF
jgi:hypothetical protein